MTRLLSIWLRDLPTRGRRGAPEGTPAVTYAKIRNAFRLTSANAAARTLGLGPGIALADARAMHPGLIATEADPQAQAEALAAVLAWCRRFTPLVAPDGEDALVLDVSGVAHLFGGEQGLMREIETRLDAQGLPAQLALASSPELAWALAHFVESSFAQDFYPKTGLHFSEILRGKIVPADLDEKHLGRLVSNLPLAALRIEPKALASLAQAGLRRIGDILHRPRAPIAARFGKPLYDCLDAMLGRAKSPISPVFEAPAYLVERRFAEGIARREDVEAVIRGLAVELGLLLERHGEGARRLEVSLFRVDGAVKRLEAGTGRPLRDPVTMSRLFRERIEAAGEDGLDTGYGFDLVRLSALAVEPLGATAPGLPATGGPRIAGPDEFADLVDRLGARIGPRRIVRLEPRDSHIPEFAVMAVPAATARGTIGSRGLPLVGGTASSAALALPPADAPDSGPALAARPLRLFADPERIETIAAVPDGPPLRFRWRRLMHEVAAIEGPERIAPEWWRANDGLTRDYFRVEDTRGRRFWLFRAGLYGTETMEPRWFVHGIFG